MDDLSPDARDVFARTWTDDRPWEFLTQLTAVGNRMAGGEGDRRASSLVADAFVDAGAQHVEFDTFEMAHWSRGQTTLELTAPDERSFEAIALPYAPAADVSGPLVDVGYGTPSEIDEHDVNGAIAVASTTTPSGGRFIHRIEKFNYAIESGAVGFVFVNHIPGQLPPTGALRYDEEALAPAVGVSKETGSWLAEYASRDGTARLTVDAATEPGESRNVEGHVGPDTEREVVFCAHFDAHDIAEGALDNGCGITTVATAVRLLAAMDLDLGVRVVGVGAEELGLTGAEHLVNRLDLDRVATVVNVDGAGRFRDLVAMTHTSEATAEVASRVADETRHPIRVDETPHPFSDQWPFVRAGIPALQLHSDSGERGRGWGHTHADTRDKVDDRNIREHAMLAALLVRELATAAANDEIPGLDDDELATAFRQADFEKGMKAAGIWPGGWE
ncbi:M28 family peptidase [Haloferax mediterranei ATCC 33500]|nr:M28 family metallopeptidase [Haloferax mediterranei]AHZ23016.1 aminopeptidase [Haloferax mediterranei ATCC 33500]ELZ99945.1 putative aminopeptidase [Haloferax mediterranei ATCC 33500]MDX5987633.1 M28 family metallopeptidase [Haloferax mediterranei ATCC 33500]QCQ74120.1 M28 family peptidase [Haloferax mediterranei ATCC 33500]